MTVNEAVLETLRAVVAPLIDVDGGELYVVASQGDEVKLHLAGTCAGCPGATLTTRGVIEPALRRAAPNARVVVTAGAIVPAGATRVLSSKP